MHDFYTRNTRNIADAQHSPRFFFLETTPFLASLSVGCLVCDSAEKVFLLASFQKNSKKHPHQSEFLNC